MKNGTSIGNCSGAGSPKYQAAPNRCPGLSLSLPSAPISFSEGSPLLPGHGPATTSGSSSGCGGASTGPAVLALHPSTAMPGPPLDQPSFSSNHLTASVRPHPFAAITKSIGEYPLSSPKSLTPLEQILRLASRSSSFLPDVDSRH